MKRQGLLAIVPFSQILDSIDRAKHEDLNRRYCLCTLHIDLGLTNARGKSDLLVLTSLPDRRVLTFSVPSLQ